MVDIACARLKADEKLTAGYNAIGFSQGAQFLRAVAQRCPHPPMRNFISLGGQHQGVCGVPCSDPTHIMCKFLNSMINIGVYYDFVQRRSLQASYWHNPLNEKSYKSNNIFLANINQENSFNASYKENFLKLNHVVLVKFEKDEMVFPIESQWFGFFKEGSSIDKYTMEESPLYTKDYLGLQTLDRSGKIRKLSVNGGHLQFTEEWFVENIVDAFLKDN